MNLAQKSVKDLQIRYGGKQLRSVTFQLGNIRTREFTRDQIRTFVQQKSNEVAARHPNEHFAVLLQYDGLERPRSGSFTRVGQPVLLHDFSYEEDPKDLTITGFSILYTFS